MIITKEYLAGFFDGEGCVTYLFGRNRVPHIGVTISNTHKGILECIENQYGGKIYLKNKYSIKHSQAYSWQTGLYKDFLTDILPFLVIKKRQAEIALEFIKTVDKTVTSNGLKKEVLEARIKMVEEIKNLNKRGI